MCMDRTPNSTRRTAAGLGAVIVGAATAVLVPSAAQAAENVDSYYNVGCTIHPDQGYASSDEPAGVSFDGERNDVSVSPVQRLVTAGSLSVYPSGATASGEDCGVGGEFSDRLIVGAGSSGLAVGDPVQVVMTVRLDADLAQGWDDDGPFETRSEYDATMSVTSLDDCTDQGEWMECDTPLDFSDEHEHHLYGGPADAWNPNGYVEAGAHRAYRFSTNAGTEVDEYVDEYVLLCDSWPCDPATHEVHPAQQPEVFTATATLVVGNRYEIEGGAGLFTQAYANPDTWASAAVEELSLDIAPSAGFEGVELAYASEGVPAEDTTAPEVEAEVSPPAVGDWHTAQATVTLSADDTGSGVESITYETTGALTTPSTVVEGDSAVLTIGTDGVTEVTYQATDLAGNVSTPQTLAVRIDTAAPVLAGVGDLTVPATGSDGAPVEYSFTATDNLGGPLTTVCTPASGSTFPVGTTPVTCTVTDEAGNSTAADFAVTVTAAGSAMDRLGEAIADSRASGFAKAALTVAYRLADSQFDAGRTRVGCTLLRTLEVLVTAGGRSIPAAEAEEMHLLIAEARVENGC